MAVLIDTSVAIDLERSGGGMERLRALVGEEPVYIAAITASELLHGVHRANSAQRRERRRRQVETLLEATGIIPFDLEIARVHSRLWADLAATGQMIGAHDIQIAATALTHDLQVATLDRKHFSRIGGMKLVNLGTGSS